MYSMWVQGNKTSPAFQLSIVACLLFFVFSAGRIPPDAYLLGNDRFLSKQPFLVELNRSNSDSGKSFQWGNT